MGERADKNNEMKVFYNLKKEKEKGSFSLPDTLNHVGRILPKGPTICIPLKTIEYAGRSSLTTGMCSTNRHQGPIRTDENTFNIQRAKCTKRAVTKNIIYCFSF